MITGAEAGQAGDIDLRKEAVVGALDAVLGREPEVRSTRERVRLAAIPRVARLERGKRREAVLPRG